MKTMKTIVWIFGLVLLLSTTGCFTSSSGPTVTDESLAGKDAGNNTPDNLGVKEQACTTCQPDASTNPDSATVTEAPVSDAGPADTGVADAGPADMGTVVEKAPDPPAPRQKVFKDVSTKEAYDMIQKKPEMVILDVRTPQEFTAGHLAKAVNIDYYASDFRTKLNQLDKEKIYLVYCASGGRSGNSLPILQQLGFYEAYNMLGGYTAWKRDGYPSGP